MRSFIILINFCIIFYLAGCGGGSAIIPSAPSDATLQYDIKTFRFTWTDVEDATHYKLLENSDGNTGYVQVGNDIAQGVQSFNHYVALFQRINASYILQACNSNGCVDGEIITISGTLANAIGYFKAGNTGGGDRFGRSVSLSGNGTTLAVGADGEDSNTSGVGTTPNDDGVANDSGAVYIFSLNSGVWQEQAYIKASNPGTNDNFGFAVSLSSDGNTLAVSAYQEDSNSAGIDTIPNDDGSANDSGAVYVFRRQDNMWSEESYIKSSNPGTTDLFGFTVSLNADGNTLAVGALNEDSNTNGVNTSPNDDGTAENSGAVYIFSNNGSAWIEEAYIKANNTGSDDRFGYSVSINGDGNILAVGALNEDSSTTGVDTIPNDDGTANDSGAVYVFSRVGGVWEQSSYIKTSNSDEFDRIGGTVVISRDGNTIAIGVPGDDSNTVGIDTIPNDDGNAELSGAVYIFIQQNNMWLEQAYIKASNIGAFESFGNAISLSENGNMLAVAALEEGSNSVGIDAEPNDQGVLLSSGAAYVYMRNGALWSEKSYLKANNTGELDQFGNSISISADGSIISVGALAESSDTTGIGSIPNDNVISAGAVYIY